MGLNKGIFWLISLALLLALTLPISNPGVTQADPDPGWYNADWSYRRAITIVHSNVENVDDPSTTYADFPVLVYATGLSNIKADGADIRFTSSDGTTELPREIESYSGGTLYAWVKVTLTKDSSDSSDDVIYMYYGNDAATEPTPDSAYGSQNVWDSNYKGVWHLSENPSGTAPQMKDSTSNNNDGTSQGSMTAGDQVTGQIDGSLDLDGSDDYIQTTSGESKTASDITWEVWFKADSTTGSHHILWQGPANQNGWGEPGNAASHEMHLTIGRMSTANLLDFFYGYEYTTDNWVPAVEIQTSFSDTTNWYYAVVVLTGAGSSPSGTLYLDGSSIGTDTGTETGRTSWNTNLRIGQCGAAQRRFDGLVDEVRVSNTARSAAWIKTSYNNQNSPSSFCPVGEEESRFVTAIEIRDQNYTTAVSAITFPEGAPGATVSTPYNDADGSGSPQAFGTPGTPVVTLFNGGSATYTIWYNITTFTNGIVSSENYLINDNGAACTSADSITNAVTFDADTNTGTTIAAGAGNEKDLYLKIILSDVAGKTGISTLTILGEA